MGDDDITAGKNRHDGGQRQNIFADKREKQKNDAGADNGGDVRQWAGTVRSIEKLLVDDVFDDRAVHFDTWKRRKKRCRPHIVKSFGGIADNDDFVFETVRRRLASHDTKGGIMGKKECGSIMIDQHFSPAVGGDGNRADIDPLDPLRIDGQ